MNYKIKKLQKELLINNILVQQERIKALPGLEIESSKRCNRLERLANKNYINDRRRRNVEEYQEKRREIGRKRRALSASVNEVFTPRDSFIVFSLFDNKCFKCNKQNDLCLDHHYPLSRGHPLEIGNAVILCRSCNSSKGAKLPEEFYSVEELIKLKTINKDLP